jgi:hypothetical protein
MHYFVSIHIIKHIEKAKANSSLEMNTLEKYYGMGYVTFL